jgi:hypothetical protein
MFPNIPESLAQTIMQPLVRLMFEAANEDIKAAWASADEVIKMHDPHTANEMRLAVRVCVLNVLGNEACTARAIMDMPLDRTIRLANGGLALIRAADKAEERLETLRNARIEGGESVEDTEDLIETDSPTVERAIALLEETKAVAGYAVIHGLTWDQAYKQRKLARRAGKRRDAGMRA